MSYKYMKNSSFKEENNDNDSSISQESLLKSKIEQEQDYISYLKTAPDFVVPEDASQFFSDILAQFENEEMNEELGLEILHTLRLFIHSQDFFTEFSEGNFLLKLPFSTSNTKYIHQILNIVYDVIKIDPTIIDSPFGDEDHFGKIVRKEPLKSLSLIGIFAQKCFNFNYEGIICPWTMIDILYNEIDTFIDYNNTDIFKQYTSILLNILNEYPIYRDYRLESYWNLFVNCLSQISDFTIIETVFNALCFLKDYFNPNYKKNEITGNRRDKKSQKYIAVIKRSNNHQYNDVNRDQPYPPELPIQLILKHIRTKSTVRCAIFKLLISYASIDPQAFKDIKLIQTLIHYSTKSLKASLILMTIAEDEDIAKIIVNNCNLWLDKGLPQSVDTFRLFMSVFQHKRLRSKLVSNDKFIPFLNFITEDLKSAGTITIIELIINHGEVTEEIMAEMRNQNFITNFLDVASQNDVESNVSSHAAMEFIRTAMSFGIYSDFFPYINWISQLKDINELKEIVSIVVAELSKDEKCARKMVSLHFDAFYEQQLNDPSSTSTLKKNANKFIRRVQKNQRKE